MAIIDKIMSEITFQAGLKLKNQSAINNSPTLMLVSNMKTWQVCKHILFIALITSALLSTACTSLGPQASEASSTPAAQDPQTSGASSTPADQNFPTTEPQKDGKVYTLYPEAKARELYFGSRKSYENKRTEIAPKLTEEQKAFAAFRGPFTNYDQYDQNNSYFLKLNEPYDQVIYRRGFYPEWLEEEEAITRELEADIVRQGWHIIKSAFIFDAVDVDGKTKWLWRDMPNESLTFETEKVDGQLKVWRRTRYDRQPLSEQQDTYLVLKKLIPNLNPRSTRYVLEALFEAGLIDLEAIEIKGSGNHQYYLKNIPKKLRAMQGVEVTESDARITLVAPIYALVELYEADIGGDPLGPSCPTGGKAVGFRAQLKPLVTELSDVKLALTARPNLMRARICVMEEGGQFRALSAYYTVRYWGDPIVGSYYQKNFILRGAF